MLERYFQLLDLPKKYAVDKTQLKNKYLEMQIKFHPDKAVNEKQRREFLEKSMKLNEAQKILKDDYLRAEYMLKLAGAELNDHTLREAISTDELEEIMEINEVIEATEDLHTLQKIMNLKLQEKDTMVRELGIFFDKNNIAKALDLTVRLKYLTNLVRNIELKVKHANSRNL